MSHSAEVVRPWWKSPLAIVGLVVVVLAVGIVIGVVVSRPSAPSTPALATTFGPFAGADDHYLTGGREIEPGLYRSDAPASSLCVISAPGVPYGTSARINGKLRQIGPDGYPLGAIVDGAPEDFFVRAQGAVEVNGPCTWNKVG